MKLNNIPVVDLFAGPGGLGEGLSSVSNDAFRIIVSAEKDQHAHATLRLRAYYRLLLRNRPEQISAYLDYCNGVQEQPWNELTRDLWEESGREALQVELGTQSGNLTLDSAINNMLDKNSPWVLIGGPPCQAYSLVGRSRNRGKTDYVPEEDHRHFLYREYLRIIQKYRPSVFVMENVKGILSSRVHGELIFHSILRDLSDPDQALGVHDNLGGYQIFSLVKNVVFRRGDSLNSIDPRDFVIKSEEYGIPQSRHRVVLLGIREDIGVNQIGLLTKSKNPVFVEDVIGGLPPLRSKLSKSPDSPELWAKSVLNSIRHLIENSTDKKLQRELNNAAKRVTLNTSHGGLMQPLNTDYGHSCPQKLKAWYTKNHPDVWLNHETRGHMESDLMRYVFASSYARAHLSSPKGADEFNIIGLRPDHNNWESGHFSDRFRVQLAQKPATTVTSHISKDGHYFIHYDPAQCRSLSVREAARIQTFPDNYFFQGNRTQQYHQVGNAVPPYLAIQIGKIVYELLSQVNLQSQ